MEWQVEPSTAANSVERLAELGRSSVAVAWASSSASGFPTLQPEPAGLQEADNAATGATQS